MVLFEHAGKDDTEKAVRLALMRAIELDCDVVAASTFGVTAEAVLNCAEELGFKNKIVIVRCVSNVAHGGKNRMTPETRAALEARGARIVTAGHALSGGERGISTRHKGAYPLEIMAAALRTFGAGVKVGYECAIMALEADEITCGRPVVAIGGTARGADSAIVITPCYSAAIFENVVHEIICKPYDIRIPGTAGFREGPDDEKRK